MSLFRRAEIREARSCDRPCCLQLKRPHRRDWHVKVGVRPMTSADDSKHCATACFKSQNQNSCTTEYHPLTHLGRSRTPRSAGGSRADRGQRRVIGVETRGHVRRMTLPALGARWRDWKGEPGLAVRRGIPGQFRAVRTLSAVLLASTQDGGRFDCHGNLDYIRRLGRTKISPTTMDDLDGKACGKRAAGE
jgi:hypothetical protein